jgi:serine/threonine-protein kinase
MHEEGDDATDATEDSFLRVVAEAPDRDPQLTSDDPKQVAHFRVAERIGRGGMGIVYRAVDERLDRVVALKILPRPAEMEEDRRLRFLREARAAAAVTHPNIATVYEVGEERDYVYIAMEHVRGATVRALLERGPLPVADALRIALGVARGMAKAHERGVVHRDLKPDNVMLNEEGEAKILDFGLAKLHAAPLDAARTKTGQRLGTPSYMSPEQWEGRDVDARSDVFSFGVMLYEMLTGTRPFDRNGPFATGLAVLNDAAPPPSSVNAAVPATLDALVARCLAKTPAERYAHAGEVAAALGARPAEPSLHAPIASGGAATVEPRTGSSLAFAATCIAALLVGAAVLSPRTVSPSPALPAAPSAAPVSAGVAMTDHPPPRSDSPEAVAHYLAGLQSFRDGALAEAGARFAHAVKIDASFAAARLRLLLYYPQTLGQLRSAMVEVAQSRARLDARDLALYEIAERLISDPDGAAERIGEATRAYPTDAEVAFVAATAMHVLGHLPEADHWLSQALALDPKFVAPLIRQVDLLSANGDVEGALAGYTHCLELSPMASTCLHIRARIYSTLGQCDKLEADAHRMMMVEPTSGTAQLYLAQALAAKGAPIESVRETLEQSAALGAASGTPGDLTASPQSAEVTLALLTGDFTAAEAHILEFERSIKGDPAEFHHALAARWRLEMYEETGESSKAKATAQAFVDRMPTLIGDAPWTARPLALFTLQRSGAMPAARFASLRDEWLRATPFAFEMNRPWLAWVGFSADPARTPREAREALASRPDAGLPSPCGFDSPFTQSFAQEGFGDRALANVYALAGDVEQALPAARRGAAACDVLSAPVAQVRAHVALGRALEAKGDAAGACEAYAYVLHRWPSPKPRSTSAELARARSAALRCAP